MGLSVCLTGLNGSVVKGLLSEFGRTAAPGVHRCGALVFLREQYKRRCAMAKRYALLSIRGLFVLSVLAGGFVLPTAFGQAVPAPGSVNPCERNVTAHVVALDQVFFYNRLGTVNPHGMIFALAEDVRASSDSNGDGAINNSDLTPGNVSLRSDKRPRPMVLRMNEGDCLEVTFTNLLDPMPLAGPATRSASLHAQGMQLVNDILDDGSNVGENPSSLVAPGGTAVYTFYAEKRGTFLLNSTGAMTGGEGNGGSMAFGLFGAVNVQPRLAEYYRSQVTQDDIELATIGTTPGGQPIIDYDAVYPSGHAREGGPIFAMLDDGFALRHTDLNAVITGPGRGNFPAGTFTPNPIYPDRDQPYREFTVLYHDEIVGIQAFPHFTDPAFAHTLHSVRDGFAHNYGTGGIGAEIIANRLGVGPMWDCTECKYEEFFLSAWVVGDPAMVVDIPANADLDGDGQADPGAKATRAEYPDDPSNVHHSYLADHVKFRILHAGPKEHHVHHQHAHQWVYSPDSSDSAYLDSQFLGPGSAYTLEMTYHGSGNRNFTVGDSIFHCHFYPHFAQGMWSMWRVHDVMEVGTELGIDGRPVAGARALPDPEIVTGTPIPAIVPLPSRPLPPMPEADVSVVEIAGLPGSQVHVDGAGNPGYPFFVPGVTGHRPPHPPMDTIDDGGLARHVITGGEAISVETRFDFSKELISAVAVEVPEAGTAIELAAMQWHATREHPTWRIDPTTGAVEPSSFLANGLPPSPGAPFAEPCMDEYGNSLGSMRTYRAANIETDVVLTKNGWHFPQQRMIALWGDVQALLDGDRAPEPFFFRANSDDCIEYHHTNLIPNFYELDDFQVRTPTDILGQHIHLVKFDVLASDGSGNGWNYEDGTFSPDEVRERIHAIREHNNCTDDDARNGTIACPIAEPHPYFGAGPNGRWLGAQTTIQRWYADDVLNLAGDDRTLRTVFTHDHYGPSTNQQVGLYAGLVIEPYGSTWRDPVTGEIMGGRQIDTIAGESILDGGPTSWRADILTADVVDSYREFMLEFSDFQLAYSAAGGNEADRVDYFGDPNALGFADPANAINPPGGAEAMLPDRWLTPFLIGTCPNGVDLPPCPEAISADDPGLMSVNYRSEPLALRIRKPSTNSQAGGKAGDLAFAFRSDIVRADPAFNVQPTVYPPEPGKLPGDPFTPLMRAYEHDPVVIRSLVGGQEEGHNLTIHGMKWLFEPNWSNSGYRNSQGMGISEHFEYQLGKMPEVRGGNGIDDYMWQAGASTDDLWTGLWGLMRVYDKGRALVTDLLPLPNNPDGKMPDRKSVV